MKPLPEGKSGALLATYKDNVRAVVKIAKETLPNKKTMQRGIPVRTHPRREVAYYQLAKLLGFEDIVPETVITTKAVDGVEASAQVFVPARRLKDLQPKLADVHRDDWQELLRQVTRRVPKAQWRRLLALDIIAGVRDRHANNVGLLLSLRGGRPQWRLAAWDNAVTFGKAFTLYHNVFHKLLFRKSVNFDEIWPVWMPITLETMQRALGSYLTLEEISHAYMRMRFFIDYPYRLPWSVVSKGIDDPKEFPSYTAYFEPVVETPSMHLFVTGA